MNPKIKGFGWAVLSMLLWAAGFPATHVLMSRELIDPVTMATLQFSLAGVILLTVGYFLKIENLFCLPKSEIWKLILLGLIGVTIMETSLFYGQKTVPALNSAILEAESPLIIGLLGFFFLKRVSLLQFIGLFTGFIGCLLTTNVLTVNGLELQTLQFGDFLIFIASFCWAIYTIFGTNVINKVGAYAFTAWTMTFGALFMILIFLTTNRSSYVIPGFSDLFSWGLITYYVLLATVLAFFSWNKAQQYISVSLLSLSEYFTPFFSGLIAWAWLNESMTGLQIFGAVIMGFAVLIDPELGAMLDKKKDKMKKVA